MQIQDKTILITGGARVGKVVARLLQDAGAQIAMTYLASEDEVASGAKGYKLNVTDEASVRVLLPAVTKDFGSVDGLVNMVSIFSTDSEAISFAEMHKTFCINAFGNMLLSRLFAEAASGSSPDKGRVGGVSDQVQPPRSKTSNPLYPPYQGEEKGRSGGSNLPAPIVSFIDWAIDHPYADYDIYMAAKAALRHYLMALQTTFAGTIRVVNIHPGMILEPEGFRPDVKQSIMDNTPTQNIGSPEQAAKLVKTALELDFLADNIYLAGGQQWRHRLKS